jgi:predicted esterase YcpF (UPF0227 family)
MNSLLKDDLLGLKEKLENLEKEFENKLKHVDDKEKKFKEIDKQIEELVNTKDTIIKLNIGGKYFQTKMSTLLNIKDTLFYKLISKSVENNEEFTKEIFIDRNYKQFQILLDYMRTKKYSIKHLNKYELEDFESEVRYYGFNEILDEISDKMKEIEIVGFTSAPRYSNCGTHNHEDLKNRNLMGGICVQSPYHIIFELNYEHEVSKIEIGGWNGNNGTWYPGNGANAKILTSTDGENFTEVGSIPSNLGATIQTVNLRSSNCKYLKFLHTSYVGLGFLNILKN